MIKITCTEEEKQVLISVLATNRDECPFEHSDVEECRADTNCWLCVSENIEWDIKENGNEHENT